MRHTGDLTIPDDAWRGDGIPPGPIVMTIHEVAPSGQPGWVTVRGWRDTQAESRLPTVVEVRADVLPEQLLPDGGAAQVG